MYYDQTLGKFYRLSAAKLVELALIREARDEDVRNDPLVVLQCRGSRKVLDTALALCGSSDAKRRELGAKILGQLGHPRSFPEECCDALLDLVRLDPDPQVMVMAIFALGHLRNPRSQPDLIKLKAHPRDIVRYAVASGFGLPQTEEAVQALMELMKDTQFRVRDWATTYLGWATDFDTPEIRTVLMENALDEDEVVRAEALHGLARRHDERAAPQLIKELLGGPDYKSNFSDAAKCYLGLDEELEVEDASLIEMLRSSLGVLPNTPSA